MIRLHLAAEHTHVEASLCAHCPDGPSGCCAAPPGLAWSDIGRVVMLGGAAFLLAQIERGALTPGPRGLVMVRVSGPEEQGGAASKRCVFHGARGCTITPEQRAATCNYYICASALEDSASQTLAASAERARDVLTETYAAWDALFALAIAEHCPRGIVWDAAFLAWLGGLFEREAKRERRSLARRLS